MYVGFSFEFSARFSTIHMYAGNVGFPIFIYIFQNNSAVIVPMPVACTCVSVSV